MKMSKSIVMKISKSAALLTVVTMFLVLNPLGAAADLTERLEKRLEGCQISLDLAQAAEDQAAAAAARRCMLRASRKLGADEAPVPWVQQRLNMLFAMHTTDALTDNAATQVFLTPTALKRTAAKTPSQARMNKIVSSFLKNDFAGQNCIAKCAKLQKGVKAGTQKCKNGGSVRISLNRCNKKGVVSFPLSFSGCKSGKKVYNGSSTLAFTVKKKSLKTVMSARNLTLEGFLFNTNGIAAQNACSGGKYAATRCSGSAKVGGKNCKMTPDCQQCRFTR